MPNKSGLMGALAGVAGAAHAREQYISPSYPMTSFSLSSRTASFSLNRVNGKVSYSSSAVRSMIIFAEDGEGVWSFRFFSTLTGLRLTHTMSCFGDKVSLLEAFSSLGEAGIAIAPLGGSAFTSPSSFLWYRERISAAFTTLSLSLR